MADHDIKYDTLPANTLVRPRGPKIADMKTALSGVNGGASYTPSRLNTMSKNDMVSACRIHGLTVAGL